MKKSSWQTGHGQGGSPKLNLISVAMPCWSDAQAANQVNTVWDLLSEAGLTFSIDVHYQPDVRFRPGLDLPTKYVAKDVRKRREQIAGVTDKGGLP